jgi:hypothetical protein
VSQLLIVEIGKISEMVTYSLLSSAKFDAGILLNNQRKLNLLNNVQRVGRISTHLPIQSECGKENHNGQGQGE